MTVFQIILINVQYYAFITKQQNIGSKNLHLDTKFQFIAAKFQSQQSKSHVDEKENFPGCVEIFLVINEFFPDLVEFFLAKNSFFLDKECFNRRVFLSKPAGFLIKTGEFSYQNPPVLELQDAFCENYVEKKFEEGANIANAGGQNVDGRALKPALTGTKQGLRRKYYDTAPEY